MPSRLVPIHVVTQIVSQPAELIKQWVAAKAFPAPVKLPPGGTEKLWREVEVQLWLNRLPSDETGCEAGLSQGPGVSPTTTFSTPLPPGKQPAATKPTSPNTPEPQDRRQLSDVKKLILERIAPGEVLSRTAIAERLRDRYDLHRDDWTLKQAIRELVKEGSLVPSKKRGPGAGFSLPSRGR